MAKRAFKQEGNDNLLSWGKKQKNTPNYKLMLKAKEESSKILGQVKIKLQELSNQEIATNISSVLTQVIKADSSNSADVKGWEEFYSTLYKYDQDINASIKAIENDPIDGAYMNNLADIYNCWGIVYLRMGQRYQAITACSKATEIEPNNLVLFSALGNSLSSVGRYNDASNALNKALKADSNDAGYFCNLGFSFFKIGDIKKAIDACSKATEMDPTNPELFSHLGFMYIRLGEYELARKPLFCSVCLNDKPDRMIFINGLIEMNLSSLEKQEMIKTLIFPLNADLKIKGVETKRANMNNTDALVKYAELADIKDKDVIKQLIEIYFKAARSKDLDEESLLIRQEALSKVTLLSEKECFSPKERLEYHNKVGKFLMPVNQILQEDSVDSMPQIFVDAHHSIEINNNDIADGFLNL